MCTQILHLNVSAHDGGLQFLMRISHFFSFKPRISGGKRYDHILAVTKTTFLYDLGNINLIFQSLPDLGDQHLQHNIFMGMSIHTWMCFSLRKWSIIHIYNPHGPEYNRGYSIYNWGYNGITHLLIRIYTHKYQPCWSTTIARETLAEAACGLQPGPRRNWDKLTKYQILGA